jgi:hypothetical protein
MATTHPSPNLQHPNVADYTIVSGGPFVVTPNNEVIRTFVLPQSTVVTQSSSQRPVACYSLVWRQGTPLLRVHLQAQGGAEEEVLSWGVLPQLAILQTIMEPITSTLLTTGNIVNRLVFSVINGEVAIRNVIISFQRSTALVPVPGPITDIVIGS